ncbi:MAG: N-ethylammeline chlorohydrolase, partial [Clostridiales bacterium]|nr:N-ethylammeline chlorohydrolase [Clostridiales bacterium]
MGILLKNIDVLPSADSPALLGADIGIEGDRIAFVQSSGAPLPPGFAADKTISGAGRLAIPGLVNAHCHSAMALLRGYADDIELETWLFDRIFPAEARLSGEDIYWGT